MKILEVMLKKRYDTSDYEADRPLRKKIIKMS